MMKPEPDALRLGLALGAAPRGHLAEAAEELVERVVLGELGHARSAAHALDHVDRHDGGTLLFVELGEIGAARRVPARGRRRPDQERGEQHERGAPGDNAAGDTMSSLLFSGTRDARLAARARQGNLTHRRGGRLAEDGDEVVVDFMLKTLSPPWRIVPRAWRASPDRLDEHRDGDQPVGKDEVRHRIALAVQRAEPLADLDETRRQPGDLPAGILGPASTGGLEPCQSGGAPSRSAAPARDRPAPRSRCR